MHAMEKDPSRRYPSASELAADVTRHLADEPVAAGPPNRTYRLKKIIRKHRTAFAAAAVSFAVLLAGVVVSTSLYVRSETARKRAETEARRSALEAEAVQAALLGDARRYQRLSGQAMEIHRSLLGKGSAGLSLYAVNRLALLELLRDGFLSADGDYQGGAELKREALDLVSQALDRGDPAAIKAATLLTDLLAPEEADSLARRALAHLRGKVVDAIRIYRRAARAGSGKAAKRLGDIFERGMPGVSRDYAESLQWYETARQLGETVDPPEKH